MTNFFLASPAYVVASSANNTITLLGNGTTWTGAETITIGGAIR